MWQASELLVPCKPVRFLHVCHKLITKGLAHSDYVESFFWHVLPSKTHRNTFRATSIANKICGKFQEKPASVNPSKLLAVR